MRDVIFYLDWQIIPWYRCCANAKPRRKREKNVAKHANVKIEKRQSPGNVEVNHFFLTPWSSAGMSNKIGFAVRVVLRCQLFLGTINKQLRSLAKNLMLHFVVAEMCRIQKFVFSLGGVKPSLFYFHFAFLYYLRSVCVYIMCRHKFGLAKVICDYDGY